MSYWKDIDEYTEEELINELEKRADARAQGLCDYCGLRAGVPTRVGRQERLDADIAAGRDRDHWHARQKSISETEDRTCKFPERHNHQISMVWALTFNRLSGINRQRCDKWHANMDEWSAADWSNAMCGEAGEAANKVKKLRRLETAGDGSSMYRRDEMVALVNEIMDEVADTILYADLLAHNLGRDLAPFIVAKFNRVSHERDFEERL